jgi:hypothetical protein
LDVRKPREEWPSYEDDGIGRVDCLRESNEHEELLYHFLRTILLHDQYKRSKDNDISGAQVLHSLHHGPHMLAHKHPPYGG